MGCLKANVLVLWFTANKSPEGRMEKGSVVCGECYIICTTIDSCVKLCVIWTEIKLKNHNVE